MITDRRMWVSGVPVVLAGWIGLLAVVMRLSGDAPAAMVIMPPDGLLAALPAGASVMARGPVSVTVSGDAGLVAALYAAGAWLVLPAGLTGCLPRFPTAPEASGEASGGDT